MISCSYSLGICVALSAGTFKPNAAWASILFLKTIWNNLGSLRPTATVTQVSRPAADWYAEAPILHHICGEKLPICWDVSYIGPFPSSNVRVIHPDLNLIHILGTLMLFLFAALYPALIFGEVE